MRGRCHLQQERLGNVWEKRLENRQRQEVQSNTRHLKDVGNKIKGSEKIKTKTMTTSRKVLLELLLKE